LNTKLESATTKNWNLRHLIDGARGNSNVAVAPAMIDTEIHSAPTARKIAILAPVDRDVDCGLGSR
jgi:hypothetical protein